MTNAQTISIERGNRFFSPRLETAAFQPVRLLPASKTVAQVEAPRQHRARRFVVAAVAAVALTVGGVAAVHVAHAGAASTPSAPASVKVDVASNPNSTVNKTITALALDGSTTAASSSTSNAALPALGAQN